MSKSESAPTIQEGNAVLSCREIAYTDRDVTDAALFRGELQPIWDELIRCIECRNQSGDTEMDEAALDAAVEKFRYDHDLITEEETEQWLEARGLTMDDFGGYFSRRFWGDQFRDKVEPPATDYVSASPEMRGLLRAELYFSDNFNRLAAELAKRVAGAAEAKEPDVDLGAEKKEFLRRARIKEKDLPDWLKQLGRDEPWLGEMLRLEAIYRRDADGMLTPEARQRELSTLRLALTRLNLEMLEVASKDAASEAAMCIRVDGLSMEEVAREGRYPFRRSELLIEDLEPDFQQKFLNAPAGSVIDPIARGDGFQLWRILEKSEPKADDPIVRARVDKRILDMHFTKLISRQIQWQGPMTQIQ